MWRQIWKLVCKFIGIVLPLFIILPLYCALFPMWYMDEEYAMYRQQKDYVVENRDANRVLIIGDSRTKAGMIPDELSADCYNLALGGTTPIEGYYTLKEYLSAHPAPEYVVVAYAPMHYMDVDALWTRNIYFHVMNRKDAGELFQTAAGCRDNANILIENYRLEYAMYEFYMPNKYCTALKNAAFIGRHGANEQKYAQVEAERGHNFFGTANGSSDVNGEAKEEDFVPSDVITLYMQKIFDLCKEQGIRVVVEQLPMNETSRAILTEDFKDHYREYMLELSQANPTVQIFGDFYMYPNDYFGDADHLNQTGASEYCRFMRERYPDIFH